MCAKFMKTISHVSRWPLGSSFPLLRTKHTTLKYHHFRSHVKSGPVDIQYRPTEEQIANFLTKPLSNKAFFIFTLRYMLCWWGYKSKAWVYPKGAFYLAQHLVIFPKLYFILSWLFFIKQVGRNVQHMWSFFHSFSFILDGYFCHHKVIKLDGCLVTRKGENTGPKWGP